MGGVPETQGEHETIDRHCLIITLFLFFFLQGLKKDKKRSRYEWNEEREQFMPRWGKGSAANDPMKDWLVEEPDSAPWGADTEALIGKGRADRRKAIAKQVRSGDFVFVFLKACFVSHFFPPSFPEKATADEQGSRFSSH